ncbi:MAG: hypothetical protein WDN75_09550 [Bacteroidota bacterium]
MNGTISETSSTAVKIVNSNPVQASIDDWGFQYRYDGRKRMIQKKMPGADWVYMIYDDRDRLVMTQDGVQRNNNEWNFTLYDALNRPVITGVYKHPVPVDQAAMSALISTSVFL